MSNTWNEIWSVYFSKLDEEDVVIWEQELFDGPNKINGLTQDELCNAIRKMANANDMPKYPKLTTLRYYIFSIRKSSSAGKPVKDKCSLCGNTGWMSFYFLSDDKGDVFLKSGVQGYKPDRGFIYMKHMDGSTCDSTYCMCSIGENVLTKAVENGYTEYASANTLRQIVMESKQEGVAA